MQITLTNKCIILLKLVKMEDQIGNAIAFLAGYLYATLTFDMNAILALIAAATSLMATNTLNQCTDIEIDAINKPDRPIPSGQISLRAAYCITVTLYSISILTSLFVNYEFMILILISTLLGIGYSIKPFRFKDRLVISNLSIAIWYGVVNFLLGWTVSKSIDTAPLTIILFLAVFDFFANMSKDYRDIEGDKAYGIRTIPLVLGERNSIILQFTGLYALYAIALISFMPSYLILLPIIGIGISIQANRDLLHRRYVACYKKMMLLYIILRVMLILLLIINVI